MEQEELIKEVYARFGLAYYFSECLHTQLCLIYTSGEYQDSSVITKPRVEEKMKYAFSLTLGSLKNEIQNLTKLFAESYNSIFTAKTPSLKVVEEDPDDNKFIECAVALDSKIIISGDKHLKNIKKYIDIEIVSPKEFIEMHE